MVLEMQASMEPEGSDPKRVGLARRGGSRSTPDAFPQRPDPSPSHCSQTVRMLVRLCMDKTEPATTVGAGVLCSTMHRRRMVDVGRWWWEEDGAVGKTCHIVQHCT